MEEEAVALEREAKRIRCMLEQENHTENHAPASPPAVQSAVPHWLPSDFSESSATLGFISGES